MIVDSEHGEHCLKTLSLLEEVARHKSVYFKQGGVDYTEAFSGNLRLALTPKLEEAFREDYDRMEEMFYGEPPTFDEIVAALQRIEGLVNKALSKSD
jgi:hypothetical protein